MDKEEGSFVVEFRQGNPAGENFMILPILTLQRVSDTMQSMPAA